MDNTEVKVVLTGDIVQSTLININERDALLSCIKSVTKDIDSLSDIKVDIYRGDSFQMIIFNPIFAIRAVFLLRAGLIMSTPVDAQIKWDARVSIGLGGIEYYNKKRVVQSDGEAFRNSGRQLDSMSKNTRIAIKSPWGDFDRDISVGLAFADSIIGDWTITQSKIIYKALLGNLSQKELAIMMEITPQAVSKLMIGGRYDLIDNFLDYYKYKIEERLK